VFNTYIKYAITFSQTQQSSDVLFIGLGQHVLIPLKSSSGPST